MGAAKFNQIMKAELKFEHYLPGSHGKKEMMNLMVFSLHREKVCIFFLTELKVSLQDIE